MRLCQLFLASRISRHIFLATTTKTNTSGNTLFYTDIMSNKHFLGVFSATYIFNHDNSRFLGMYLFIFISHIRLFCNRHGKQTSIPIMIMGDTWWVIIICPCVNVFSLMGGVTEADVGFPTVEYQNVLSVKKRTFLNKIN